jgi:hypothetical protein
LSSAAGPIVCISAIFLCHFLFGRVQRRRRSRSLTLFFRFLICLKSACFLACSVVVRQVGGRGAARSRSSSDDEPRRKRISEGVANEMRREGDIIGERESSETSIPLTSKAVRSRTYRAKVRFDVVQGFQVLDIRFERSSCRCRGQAMARGRATRSSLSDRSPRFLSQLKRKGNSSFADTGQTVDSRPLLARAPWSKGLLSVQLSRGSTTHHLPRVAGPTVLACQLLLSTRRGITPVCVRTRLEECFSGRSRG